jgi:hypothetical protein
MERVNNFCLREMTDSLKQIEEFRNNSKIDADRETEKLHLGLIKKLKNIETVVKEAMFGIV